MHLGFRQVLARDLEWCASILRDGFEHHTQLHERLPSIWKQLLDEDAMFMSVLEDNDAPKHLVAFGATVFVSDRFLAKAKTNKKPHLAVQMLEREDIPRNRVILRPEEVRKQSRREGLNLVILHYAEVVDGYSEEDSAIVRDSMVYGLLETHRRHNLKFLLYEFYGVQDVAYILESGATLISDFADWYQQPNRPLPDPVDQPFLVGIDREKARKHRASWLSWLFLSPPARVGLSPAEQKIAIRALAGETDAQLAHNPEISPNTVRKHWRSIFKKFEAASINLIPAELAAEGKERASAGDTLHKKKRPFLLNYLRQHPEELRPQAAARASVGNGD